MSKDLTYYEKEEIQSLRQQGLSDEMIMDTINSRRELERWKEQQGIY